MFKIFHKISLIIVLLFATGLIYFFYKQSFSRDIEACYLCNFNIFKTENIVIQNRKFISQENILKILNSKNQFKENENVQIQAPLIAKSLLFISAKGIRKAMIESGLFEEVVVKKIFPNTLHIYLEEKEPFAFWHHENQISLIDKHGNILTDHEDIKSYTLGRMIHLFGVNANLYGFELIERIKKYKNISESLVFLSRIDDRRWDFNFEQKIVVKMPVEITEKTLLILENFLEKKQHVENIEILDMRNSNKIYIKYRQKT